MDGKGASLISCFLDFLHFHYHIRMKALVLPRLRLRRLLLAVVILAVLISGILAGTLSHVLSRFAGNATFPADCGLVFGTAVRPVYDRGAIVYTGPGPGILRRVAAAADLYRTGRLKKVFLTGGRGEGMAESEASVMQRIAVVQGIRLEDIVIEQESHSTVENLRHSLPLMEDCMSIVGISDRYHLARIELLAARTGQPIMTYPAEANAGAAFEARSILREALGIMLTLSGG